MAGRPPKRKKSTDTRKKGSKQFKPNETDTEGDSDSDDDDDGDYDGKGGGKENKCAKKAKHSNSKYSTKKLSKNTTSFDYDDFAADFTADSFLPPMKKKPKVVIPPPKPRRQQRKPFANKNTVRQNTKDTAVSAPIDKSPSPSPPPPPSIPPRSSLSPPPPPPSPPLMPLSPDAPSPSPMFADLDFFGKLKRYGRTMNDDVPVRVPPIKGRKYRPLYRRQRKALKKKIRIHLHRLTEEEIAQHTSRRNDNNNDNDNDNDNNTVANDVEIDFENDDNQLDSQTINLSSESSSTEAAVVEPEPESQSAASNAVHQAPSQVASSSAATEPQPEPIEPEQVNPIPADPSYQLTANDSVDNRQGGPSDVSLSNQTVENNDDSVNDDWFDDDWLIDYSKTDNNIEGMQTETQTQNTNEEELITPQNLNEYGISVVNDLVYDDIEIGFENDDNQPDPQTVTIPSESSSSVAATEPQPEPGTSGLSIRHQAPPQPAVDYNCDDDDYDNDGWNPLNYE